MAKAYYKQILAGNKTIEDVPEKYREEVQALIDADN